MGQAGIVGQLIVGSAGGTDIGSAACLTVNNTAKDTGIVEELEVGLALGASVYRAALGTTVDVAADA